MVTWQFWTLIGVLVVLGYELNSNFEKIATKLDVLNVTLGDLRAQNQELIGHVVGLPDQIANEIDARKG